MCAADESCPRFVNVNRRGGFGLRGLLASATVENEAMDHQQVSRAQKKLDSKYAGNDRRATLIYDIYNSEGRKPSQASQDGQELKAQREPDEELDTLWAPERCTCRCGCRAQLGNGEGSRCKDCRCKGSRHQRLLQHEGRGSCEERSECARSRSRSWQRPRHKVSRRSRRTRSTSS
ncbi:unnamed protein product [Effrenium voratum]|uniref:Uncharacterized protein n=1 Tax=Effrenium voratum TaxID=2562239 RepID=A0AA36I4T2_9DINO|nr:unnamed protein product [Effrenium voratum]CAJ1450523.1 unnamed protein product [Effrenium voratum]